MFLRSVYLIGGAKYPVAKLGPEGTTPQQSSEVSAQKSWHAMATERVLHMIPLCGFVGDLLVCNKHDYNVVPKVECAPGYNVILITTLLCC